MRSAPRGTGGMSPIRRRTYCGYRATGSNARGMSCRSTCGRADVIVEIVVDRGRQIAVALVVRLGIRLLEQIKLELRAKHRLESELTRALDLSAQHLTR